MLNGNRKKYDEETSLTDFCSNHLNDGSRGSGRSAQAFICGNVYMYIVENVLIDLLLEDATSH